VKALLSLATGLLRLALALGLLGLCLVDVPRLRAEMALAALPDIDVDAQLDALIAEDRWSEAHLVAEGEVDACTSRDAADPACAHWRDRLAAIDAERASLRRHLLDAGQGALAGTGETPAALTGAIVSDLLVFGDVRDLALEAGKSWRGEPVDPVLVGLSALGIALTVSPGVDVGTALLKFARRAGALTRQMAEAVVRLTRRAADERSLGSLRPLLDDAGTLAARAEPAGAVRILRAIESPAELATAARVAKRPAGARALWLGGGPALTLAGRTTLEADALLLRAARKGADGVTFAARNADVLLRAHPLLGLVKGIYKGTVPQALAMLVAAQGLWLAAFAAAWSLFEGTRCTVRGRRLLRRRSRPSEPLSRQGLR